MSDRVRVVREGAVVRVTLERPPLNILDRQLNRALAEALDRLAGARDCAVVVLSGGEQRAFSAGVEIAEHVPEAAPAMLEDFHAAVRALGRCECVTIAAVRGAALGGGLELALACDLVLAEETAKLGLPEIQLGCYPPIAAAILPARIGWAAACELVLTGEAITPARALALGLVNRVCPEGGLAAATDELVRALTRHSPAVLREAKRALREGAAQPPSAALRRIEQRFLDDLMSLSDAEEGIRAFLEKRAPVWRNR